MKRPRDDRDPLIKALLEIEREAKRVKEDFEQRQAEADLVPEEDRDEAWRDARERRYQLYVEDMKILAAQYKAIRDRRETDRLH